MLGSSSDSYEDTSKGVFTFTEVVTEKLRLPPISAVSSQVTSPTFHHKSSSLSRVRSHDDLFQVKSRLELLDSQAQE